MMLYLQMGQNNVVVDNIHSIIAAAGVKFNAQLLEHLFSLIHSVSRFIIFQVAHL